MSILVSRYRVSRPGSSRFHSSVLHSPARFPAMESKSPLSQSLHANRSGGEVPPGRMDWSRTDFWLAAGTGKNRSSTTTSPCTPYPLPSELQGDKVGKDYLLQNLHLDMRTGLSNGQPHSTLEKARFLAERIGKTDYVNTYDKKTQSAILHAK